MPKILAIDDKTDNLISLSALLKIMIPGCEITTATSGSEGIEKAKIFLPDTILLDIKMPGMDGYEVCKILKKDERLKHIPVIMISAILTESKDQAKGLDSGADAYLAKPIDEYVLTAQVTTALRIKRVEDKLRGQAEQLEEEVEKRTAQLVETNEKLNQEIAEHRLAREKNKGLESQLIQSHKMEAIGTLAGGIAHDFNNILFPIVGHAEVLLEDVPEESPFWRSLNGIYSAALRAKDLVNQILTFSRQEKNELKLIKVQNIIKEASKLIRSTIPKTIDIQQNIQADCSMIKADPTQIHQVVMNLSINAYHAMADTGGELKLDLTEKELTTEDIMDSDMIPGTYACLTISDSGVGMDKEVMEKIFDPFFTTKEKSKGTGMGLSVVHGIVKKLNGSIRVSSEPGKGTEFIIYFPVEKNIFEKQKTQNQTPIRGGKEHILFIDDEEPILELGVIVLERLGYQVTAHVSSIEALETFRKNYDKFDIVITDMSMPNMGGDRLAAELIKIRPEIPILICTGFSENMSEEKAAVIGVKGILFKPIIMKDLAWKIRKVLDEK